MKRLIKDIKNIYLLIKRYYNDKKYYHVKNKVIKVFKCDHCHHFTQDAEEMRMHEAKCSFNPALKKCYTCLHSYEAGMPISGSMRGCEKKLDIIKGEEVGMCVGWEADA